MSIVWLILKILLIILLSILGIVLLLVLLVLFAPVHYKLAGAKGEENLDGDVSVRWLFAKVAGHYEKDDGFKLKISVFGIPLKSGGGKKSKPKKSKEKKKKKAEIPASDVSSLSTETNSSLANVTTALTEETNASPEASQSTQVTSGTEEIEDLSFEEFKASAKEIDGMSAKELKKAEKKRKKELKKQKKLEAKANGKEKNIADTIDHIQNKTEEGIDKVTAIYDKVMLKKNHIQCFLEKEYTKKTLQRVKKILIRTLKTVKPKKSKGSVTFGMGNAADTGLMYGRMCFLYPLTYKWLQVTPDFYYKRAEFDVKFKGRIMLGRIAIPAVIMVLSPSFRKTLALAKKI